MRSPEVGSGHVLHEADVAWDERCDVLVVGSGLAGSSAAFGALSTGAKPVVIEKAQSPGGTFAKSAGAVWLPGGARATESGESSLDSALRLLARAARPVSFDPDGAHLGLDPEEHELLVAYVSSAHVVAEELEELGTLSLAFSERFPDYRGLEGAVPVGRGRSGAPVGQDGVALRGAGQAQRFQRELRRRGVDLRCDQTVDAVVVADSGEIVGARLRTSDGDRFIRALGGVVFASGGFTQSPRLRRQYLPAYVLGGAAVPTNQGDFVEICVELGVPLFGMGSPWMAPVPLERLDDPDMCPLFTVPGDSMIFLNRHGDRRVNEKGVYHEIAHAFGEWDPYALEYPNLVQVMVFDQRVRDGWGPPTELDDQARKAWPLQTLGDYVGDEELVEVAHDLDELAVRLNGRLDKLRHRTGGASLDADWADRARSTIERFNQLAAEGEDTDLRRGGKPIEVAFGSRRSSGSPYPNPLMHPISDEGPYYAILVVAGTLDTAGGPRIDPDGRVSVDPEAWLDGLYAAGNCAASPFGEGYAGGGVPNGGAMVFGFRAGQHAGRRAAESDVSRGG